jgi:hypothetical protein
VEVFVVICHGSICVVVSAAALAEEEEHGYRSEGHKGKATDGNTRFGSSGETRV